MTRITRRSFVLSSFAAAALVVTGLPAYAASEILEVYKTPWCGCCTAWVDHMREAGFAVRVTEMEDLTPLKARHGVSAELASCHTALIGGYVVEGHVPASDVARLLKERPEATGLAVPGMPVGSPGMEMGDERDSYEVVLFGPAGSEAFSRY
ncbi:DUF411 domain-containing protein [Parvibaculum sp.]|uniref:DUF411 domain-containing protein n=1 Tax=Parvibaculum sp. TaxID=2024848 RepID=UPI003298E914